MQEEQAKIYHHHTPREYLLPWADADECIAWFGYGKVARSGLTVVGGENDFYKLKELTADDVAKIRWVIQQLPELGRAGHEDFLWSYVLPTRLRRRVEQCIARDPTRMSEQQIAEARNRINVVIFNLNENYHASIERRFWPYLNASKYPPAEPVALRLLAPQRGLFATVRSKSKNKSKNLVLLSTLPLHRQFEGEHTPGILKVLLPPRQSRGISRLD